MSVQVYNLYLDSTVHQYQIEVADTTRYHIRDQFLHQTQTVYPFDQIK
jgi:hypothetical protein